MAQGVDWEAAKARLVEYKTRIEKYTTHFSKEHPEWHCEVMFVDYPPRLWVTWTWSTDDGRLAEAHDSLSARSYAINPPEQAILEVAQLTADLALACDLRIWRIQGNPGEQKYELRPYYSNYQL